VILLAFGQSKPKTVISCRNLVNYSQAEIIDPKNKGRLTDDALLNLMNHVEKSELLTGEEIDIIIDTIRGYLAI